MKDYIIKLIHPEYGQHSELPAQGTNAFEALENALGYGHHSSVGVPMIALVRNVSTGFIVKIEYVFE